MKLPFLSFLTFLSFLIQSSMAQTIIQRDPQIEAMVAQVSPDSMKSYIQQLVRFGTGTPCGQGKHPSYGN